MNLIKSSINPQKIRVIAFDVTGTLLVHRYPIMQTYAEAAMWAKLENPPSASEIKVAFKEAYYTNSLKSPCFGSSEGISSREWWKNTVRQTLKNCGREYSAADFDRYFRRIYQHFGSLNGYELLSDAINFLKWAKCQKGNNESSRFSLGIITNTPTRTVETTLPMLGIHDYFQWFLCAEDVGCEKPDKRIFDEAYSQAKFWIPDLKRDEILHIGDNLAADFCGARAAGFQSVFLDRSYDSRVVAYQDWLKGPTYEGKTQENIISNTVKDFYQIQRILE